MGLASIPFLVSIWTAVVSILKSLWDAAKSRVLLIGLFLGKVIRWVLDLIKKWFTYKFVLATLCVGLIAPVVISVLGLIPQIQAINQGWQNLLDLMPGASWLLWDKNGIIRLSVFFRGMITTVGVWITGIICQILIRKLRWSIQIMLNTKLRGD